MTEVEQSEKSFDCYIAHEWGTHAIARELKTKLNEHGVTVWLDEDNLGDNVALDITKGLTQSAVVILLLTQRYFKRCEDHTTFAHKEFIMANKRGSGTILPLVVDEDLLNPLTWPNGVVKFHVGDILWIAYANQNQRKDNFMSIVERVTPFRTKMLEKVSKLKVPIKKKVQYTEENLDTAVKRIENFILEKNDLDQKYWYYGAEYKLIISELKISKDLVDAAIKLGVENEVLMVKEDRKGQIFSSLYHCPAP